MNIKTTHILASFLGAGLLVAACGGKDSGPFSGNGSIRAFATGGPQFPGSGTSFAGFPLSPAQGPGTANDCSLPPPAGTNSTVVETEMQCFYGDTSDPNVPAATIEHVVEILNGVEAVHVRITFNPTFVDNSYGDTAIGWGGDGTDAAAPAPPAPGMGPGMGPGGAKAPKPPKGPKGHTFKDLVGSDHVELTMTDAGGSEKLKFMLDYISEDASSPCGYGTLGVSGGEGKMETGSASSILAVATSLDRDLNGCGYCYTENSPATDENYTPNADTPKWDYRVVYEVWVDPAVFGSAGFGDAIIGEVHASPSKLGSNTVEVVRKPCPPDWDTPVCPAGSTCNSTGTGGSSGLCPPGYVPDLASEGKFCVPE